MKRWILCLSLLCFSCDDITEVEDISEETLVVLAPVNDAVVITNNLTFTWEGVEAAETYHLQIATPNFASAVQIVKDTTLNTTSFATTLNNNSYQWRVRAEKSGYHTTYTTQNFRVEE
ncbi:hypothetical protein EYD45_07530 [Hyunsoonleella flava]|uniref:Fibronectin type-III domain-containing protein n=1 Tax=Hyunsoonleella flava TaxID=2527939 RepID=A0A4Q9FK66_9FLAO|nr:hypothetical protein [Hyunsoonleella flava]TBN04459.1 hypothetical protein EYD45_07530 [Hyunsoonleella flava]